MPRTISAGGKAALITMAISGSAGALAGYQGRRRNRTARMLTGAAYGALTGGRIIQAGKNAESVSTMFKTAMGSASLRHQLYGSGIGAAGSFMMGGSMGTGAIIGGIGGMGISGYRVGGFKGAWAGVRGGAKRGWDGISSTYAHGEPYLDDFFNGTKRTMRGSRKRLTYTYPKFEDDPFRSG